MPGAPDQYPQELRDYVISEVLDRDRKLAPIVESLNRGTVDGFDAVPLSYSAARRWIAQERQLRDAAAPLEERALDAFVQRLWGIASAELRKLERDSRGRKPVDVKRLNDLEAFATRARRHLKTRDESPGDEDPKQKPATSESLLDRLAAQEARKPASDEAPRHDSPGGIEETPGPTQPTVAQQQKPAEPIAA